jgi:hypothetical protein
MATKEQVQAAKKNIAKARKAATRKRTIASLPKAVRTDLSRNAAAARKRGGKAGHRLEDRTRPQLYEEAKKRNIRGR